MPVEPASSRAILVVDDESAIVSIVGRQLAEESLRLTTMTDPAQALEALRDTHYAAVISDNRMPGVTGLALLKFVMGRSPNTRRILMTGYSDMDEAIQAFNERTIHRFIRKPWQASELVQAVREELAIYARRERDDLTRQELKRSLRRRSLQLQEALNAIRQADEALELEEGDPSVARRLAAVIVADVVGYSRLMGSDATGTLSTLTACRAIWFERIARHGGRLVNAPGDGLLAEFDSAAAAIQCAREVQHAMADHNGDLPEPRRMHYRIGVTVGEVLEQGGSLYGEGVNIAARLQSLAAPGEVWLSQAAFDFARGGLEHDAEFMGEQRLHNIAEPVRAYRIRD